MISTILPPTNDPDSMVACNYSACKVCFLVNAAGVHEEVRVDFHDCLHWTLGPDLMHDVLLPPPRLSCACLSSHPVGRLHLHLLSRTRRPCRADFNLTSRSAVRQTPGWPGPMMSQESPSPIHMATP